MGCGCGGKKFSSTRTSGVTTRSPVSQHAPSTAIVRPTSTHQPSTAPAHVVRSTALQQRRAAITRRQV